MFGHDRRRPSSIDALLYLDRDAPSQIYPWRSTASPPRGVVRWGGFAAAINVVRAASSLYPHTRRQRALVAARRLVNAAIDRDLSAGLVSAFAIIAEGIQEYCKDQGPVCRDLPLTTAQVQKTFGLLNAFVWIEPRSKKHAMEQLIDTFADRGNRDASGLIVSTGVGVGLSIANLSRRTSQSSDYAKSFAPGLSLPLCLSLEWMSSVAQYAAVNLDGEVSQPNFGTAVFFGGTFAFRYGSPSVPMRRCLGYKKRSHTTGVPRTDHVIVCPSIIRALTPS